jgi:hypothetical protein
MEGRMAIPLATGHLGRRGLTRVGTMVRPCIRIGLCSRNLPPGQNVRIGLLH